MTVNDVITIGYDAGIGDEIASLVVARRSENGSNVIVSHFFGQEAIELYEKLTKVERG